MRLRNLVALVMLTASSTLGSIAPTRAAEHTQETNYEGLTRVDAARFDVAYLRPGIDFAAYDGLIIGETKLAFRTPDRRKQQFPLSAEQKRRFREVLAADFREEFTKVSGLNLVEEPAPSVLRLQVRVQNILATVPPVSVGSAGRAAIALEAIGEATLVLELSDSESGEIFARVADTKDSEGVAVLQGDGAITRWSDIERICARWAKSARKGLEALLEAN